MTEKKELMTPKEVADLFGVHPKTVARWAAKGLFPEIRTLGRHRRYPRWAVEALYDAQDPVADAEKAREARDESGT